MEENNTGDTIKKKEGKAEAAGSPPKMLELLASTPPKKLLKDSVVSPLVNTPTENSWVTGGGRINNRLAAERRGCPGWRLESPLVCGHTPRAASDRDAH